MIAGVHGYCPTDHGKYILCGDARRQRTACSSAVVVVAAVSADAARACTCTGTASAAANRRVRCRHCHATRFAHRCKTRTGGAWAEAHKRGGRDSGKGGCDTDEGARQRRILFRRPGGTGSCGSLLFLRASGHPGDGRHNTRSSRTAMPCFSPSPASLAWPGGEWPAATDAAACQSLLVAVCEPWVARLREPVDQCSQGMGACCAAEARVCITTRGSACVPYPSRNVHR